MPPSESIKTQIDFSHRLFSFFSWLTLILYAACVFLVRNENITQTKDVVLNALSDVLLWFASASLVCTAITVFLMIQYFDTFKHPSFASKKSFVFFISEMFSLIVKLAPKFIFVILVSSVFFAVYLFIALVNSGFIPLIKFVGSFVLIGGIAFGFLWLCKKVKEAKMPKIKFKLPTLKEVLAVIFAITFSFFLVHFLMVATVVVHNLSIFVVPHIETKMDNDFYSTDDVANILIFSKGFAKINWINVTYSNTLRNISYIRSSEFSGAPIYLQIDNLTSESYNSYIKITYKITNFHDIPFFPRNIPNSLLEFFYKTEFVPVVNKK